MWLGSDPEETGMLPSARWTEKGRKCARVIIKIMPSQLQDAKPFATM